MTKQAAIIKARKLARKFSHEYFVGYDPTMLEAMDLPDSALDQAYAPLTKTQLEQGWQTAEVVYSTEDSNVPTR